MLCPSLTLPQSRLERKIIQTARDLRHVPELPKKHFSFLVRRNRIIEIGWNKGRTHPLFTKFGYEDHSTIHSEMDVLLKYRGDLDSVSLWNVRVNKRGEIRISRPCKSCELLIAHFGIDNVFYTVESGQFVSAT